MQAHDLQPALPLRSHTILGVCEGIAEDFGFDPVLLRVPFAVTVLWSPTMAVAAYFALGLVVLASRLLFPQPKAAVTAVPADTTATDVVAANSQSQTDLPLAA